MKTKAIMDTFQAIHAFKSLCSNVKETSMFEFLTWIKENIDDMTEDFRKHRQENSDVILDSIRDSIKSTIPVNGISCTETIISPVTGQNKDCNLDNTVHVDAFCYNDDDVDDLCDEGTMSRNYCKDCRSRNIIPLTFITHSASVEQIKYIYKYLLPDIRGKTLVDVGSRTGAMLYGAYLYSTAQSIIGVEMDPSFCQLQQKIVLDYKFQDRIKVVQSDILTCGDILSSADVVIMNNVFEFFLSPDQQRRIWEFLSSKLKKSGSVLVTVPSIEESLGTIQSNIDVTCWLRPVDTKSSLDRGNVILYGTTNPEESDLQNIYCYEVI